MGPRGLPTAACRREDPALDDASARERAQAVLASLTGYGLTSLIDPTFDMAAHARGLLDRVGAARLAADVPEPFVRAAWAYALGAA